MKSLFISSNKGSLLKLGNLVRQLSFISNPDFVLVNMQSFIATDVIAALKAEKDLDRYDLIILADKDWDQEIAAGIAVSLEAGCSTKCAYFIIEGDSLKITREVFGGLANLNLKVQKKPYVLTLATSFLNDAPSEDDGVDYEEVLVKSTSSTVELLDFKKIDKSVDLTSAKKIVSVGRGIDKEENLPIIEALTKAMKAEMGCSRPISEDFKWLPLERQVGLTGEIVKPDLYMAIGISGQVQHVVGMRDSKIVIAININKNAPIFEFCDYGLVGDLFEIVPLLTQHIKEAS